MDNALQDDIDYHQFKYFSDIADNMNESDRVILMTHEPDWIVDSHFGVTTSSNIAHLIQKLRGRVVARVAGDIHNYTRHMPILRDQHITQHQYTWYDRLPSFIHPSRVIQAISSIGADLLHWSENSGSAPLYDDLIQHCPTKLNTSPTTLQRMKSDPTTQHTHDYIDKHIPAVHHISNTRTHSPTFNLLDSPPVSDVDDTDDYQHANHSNVATPDIHRANTESNINYHNTTTYSAYGSQTQLNSIQSQQSINDMATTPNASIQRYNSSQCITLDTNRITDWSMHDVCMWLSYIGCSECCDKFQHYSVDGKLLLALTDDDLTGEELNITSKLRRKKIMLELNQLKLYLSSSNKPQYLHIPYNTSNLSHTLMDTPINGSTNDLFNNNNLSTYDLIQSISSQPIHSISSQHDLVSSPANNLYRTPINTSSVGGVEQFDAQKPINQIKTIQEDSTVHQSNGDQTNHHTNGTNSNMIDPPPVINRDITGIDHTVDTQPRNQSSTDRHRNKLNIDTSTQRPHPTTHLHHHKSYGKQQSHWHGAESDTPIAPVMPPVLLVSGGGGAFMHPTHVPAPLPINVRGQPYQRTCCYPSVSTSRNYALLNIFGFRKRNWRFDIMGGAVYFLLALSFFPMCNLNTIIESESYIQLFATYLNVVALTHIQLFTHSYISLFVFICILISTISFTESNWPLLKRCTVGTVHAFAHSIAALSVLVLMECMIELGITKQIVAQTPLFDVFTQHFPEVQELFTLFDQYTYNLTTILAYRLTAIFDIPDAMASYKLLMCHHITSTDIHTPAIIMTRYQTIIYYCSTYLYYYVLSAPLVSFVFGSYLYTANCFLSAHLTESFSSLRIESYKNFIRFHINQSGDCEVFVLGMDRVPKSWRRNKSWTGLSSQSTQQQSYEWSSPSVWVPAHGEPNKVKLVDYMLLSKTIKAKDRYSDLINDKKHIVPA